MKRLFGVVLAMLCMFTLSFSGVFAAQAPEGKDTVYKITTSASHGTITPTNSKVGAGSTQTITYSAEKGYQLKSVTVDDKAQDIAKYANRYVFEKVSANHTINVAYEKLPALSYHITASKAPLQSGDKVTYTVKVSQTNKDAEARGVKMVDTLAEGLVVDKASVKGDVKVVEAKDNVCSVVIDSLKDTVTYSYTATASKDIKYDDVIGNMKMSADNMKTSSGTSTVVPSGNDPKQDDSDKTDTDKPGQQGQEGQQGGQTPSTEPGQNEPGQQDDQKPDTTLVNVELTKAVSNATPAVGDTVTYAIVAKKPQNVQKLQNVIITDQVPQGITVDTASVKITGSEGKVTTPTSVANTGQSSDVSSNLYVTIPELTADTTVIFSAKVTAKSGEVVNVAKITGEGIAANEASAKFTVKTSQDTQPSQPTDQTTPSEPAKPTDQTQPTDETKPTVETFVVTFVDGQGKTLKTENVEKGKAATAPSAPTREGYTFDGWDKSFDNVTSNLTVTAKWKVEEKKYSLKDKVYVAKNGEYWHYDINCDGLNHADKKQIDTMTLEQAKKEANRSDHPTTGSKCLVECPDCAKGSTEATGGPYKGDPVNSTKPELKKVADKKEAGVSEVVKYTVTVTAKDDEITDVVVKDTLPSGMELVKDSVKASDDGKVETKDNVITVKYDKLQKKSVTITYEAKATKEGEMKNVATLNYNKSSDSKGDEIKAEATVKISGSAGDGSDTVERASYKTGDFIPYIVGGVLVALLIAAFVVYKKRGNGSTEE